MQRIPLFLSLLLIFLVAPVSAQQSDPVIRVVTGKLVEQGSGIGLCIAQVEALDAQGNTICRTNTGFTGEFTLKIPSTMKNEPVTLRFSRKGWFTQEIENYFPSRSPLAPELKRRPLSRQSPKP